MANTARRKIKGGKMFLPQNMKGRSGKENFLGTNKIIILCLIPFGYYLVFSYGSTIGLRPVAWVIVGLLLFYATQKIIRKLILEENYFYNIYDRVNKLGDITPAIFWKVASIRKSSEGDIMVFNDTRIACIVRLERDTIVGKAEDSSEKHYDAWSDFYKEVHNKDMEFIQMNLMEPSGKDPRLAILGNTAGTAKNANVRDALEMEMGYLKAISSATLSEFDYLMFFDSVKNIDSFISKIGDCTYKLLNGAYSSAKVLHEYDIYEIPKIINNVEYFDGIQAQMNVYTDSNMRVPAVLSYSKIHFADGTVRELSEEDVKVLQKLASLIQTGGIKKDEWTIKMALDGKIDKLNNFNLKSHKIETTINEKTAETTAGKAVENKESTQNKKNKAKKKKGFFNKKKDITEDEKVSIIDDDEDLFG